MKTRWSGSKKIPVKYLTGPRHDILPKAMTRTATQAKHDRESERRRLKNKRAKTIKNCPGHQYEPYMLYRCPEVVLFRCELCFHVKFENGMDAMEFQSEYNRRINKENTISKHVNMDDMLTLEQKMMIKS
jgi:hypothetical protein